MRLLSNGNTSFGADLSIAGNLSVAGTSYFANPVGIGYAATTYSLTTGNLLVYNDMKVKEIWIEESQFNWWHTYIHS
jgi:hypothetical protein